MNRRFLPLLTLPLLAACGGLDDSRFATGSSTVATDSNFATLHVVDADSGVVGSMDAEGNELGRLEIGGEPTRIARLGDKYLVSQRTQRTVAVLSENSDGLQFDSQILVGNEPFGVVASEDGTKAYVAASLSGTVSEIDAESLEVTRSWTLTGEPRWLALHPSGSSLFVGSAYGAEFHRIDLGADTVESISFPTMTATTLADGEAIALTPRMTGDLAVSPNGKALAIPVLYVENVTPVPPPGSDEFGDSGGGYAADNGGGDGGGRFNGTVVLMDLGTDGTLTGDDTATLSLNGFIDTDDFATVGGYASSLAWDTANEHVFVSMEAAGAVLRVQCYQRERYDNSGGVGAPGIGREPMPVPDDGFFEGEFFGLTGASINQGQLQRHATDTIATGAGPRGLAMLESDQVFVHSFMDRSLQKLPADQLPARNEFGETDEELASGGVTNRTVSIEGFGGTTLTAAAGTTLAPDVLSTEVREGRRLFFSSTDSRMSSHAAPVSCSTCHMDGRTDGVTWTFFTEEADVITLQTPSLAGEVSATAPVTWLSNVETVADEAMTTSQGRMGGDGLAISEATLVAEYIDWSRAPDSPNAGVDSAAITRGEAIFDSEEVGCGECHSGEAYTDNDVYDLYGLENVRTRGLVGIAASAPYLHDGSASSLEGLMERSRDGSMGDTSSLTDAEIDDLVAFLKSL